MSDQSQAGAAAPDECTTHLTMGVCNRGTPGCSKEHAAAPDVIDRLRQIADTHDGPLVPSTCREAADALSAARTLLVDWRKEHRGCRPTSWGDNRCELCKRTDAALGGKS